MLCIVERLVGHEIVLRYLMVGGGVVREGVKEA